MIFIVCIKIHAFSEFLLFVNLFFKIQVSKAFYLKMEVCKFKLTSKTNILQHLMNFKNSPSYTFTNYLRLIHKNDINNSIKKINDVVEKI